MQSAIVGASSGDKSDCSGRELADEMEDGDGQKRLQHRHGHLRRRVDAKSPHQQHERRSGRQLRGASCSSRQTRGKQGGLLRRPGDAIECTQRASTQAARAWIQDSSHGYGNTFRVRLLKMANTALKKYHMNRVMPNFLVRQERTEWSRCAPAVLLESYLFLGGARAACAQLGAQVLGRVRLWGRSIGRGGDHMVSAFAHHARRPTTALRQPLCAARGRRALRPGRGEARTVRRDHAPGGDCQPPPAELLLGQAPRHDGEYRARSERRHRAALLCALSLLGFEESAFPALLGQSVSVRLSGLSCLSCYHSCASHYNSL